MKHIQLFETFIDLDANDQTNKPSRKSAKYYNAENIFFKISPENLGLTFYRIYDSKMKFKQLGAFSIRYEGSVPIDPSEYFKNAEITDAGFDVNQTFDNSILLKGGFIIRPEYQKMGVGEAAIKRLFMEKPDIENIFLYAIEWQNAVPFWHKIGGVSILDNGSMHYIQLSRDKVMSAL